MKNFYCLIFFGISVVSVIAADVESRRTEALGKRYEKYESSTGKIYRNVRITKITDAGVSIIHDEGVARLGFEELCPEKRMDYGITKEGATQFDAKEMAFTAAYKAKVEEQQKFKLQNDAKYMAALVEVERLTAEKALREQNEMVATIESSGKIPVFPTIIQSEREFYGSRRYSHYRSVYHQGGRYAYPISYGYYPRNCRSYYPTRNACNSNYGSIFHFTIK